MQKVYYVVTKMDDNYEVTVLGIFFNRAEAVEAIKRNIFYYVSVDDVSSSFVDTTYIPDFTYQIHETGIYDVDLR